MSLGLPGITPWLKPRVRGVEKVTTIWSWCSPEFVLLQCHGCLYQRAPWQQKTGCGRENQLRNNLRKTHTHMKRLWWQFGRLLKIWIVDVDYWMSFADIFIWLFFGLKPNCQTWDFFQFTLNGLHWAKKNQISCDICAVVIPHNMAGKL